MAPPAREGAFSRPFSPGALLPGEATGIRPDGKGAPAANSPYRVKWVAGAVLTAPGGRVPALWAVSMVGKVFSGMFRLLPGGVFRVPRRPSGKSAPAERTDRPGITGTGRANPLHGTLRLCGSPAPRDAFLNVGEGAAPHAPCAGVCGDGHARMRHAGRAICPGSSWRRRCRAQASAPVRRGGKAFWPAPQKKLDLFVGAV